MMVINTMVGVVIGMVILYLTDVVRKNIQNTMHMVILKMEL